nr:putative ribonuclease H-like domain-containing protein [Tanacetum cinerariifolium]
RDGENLNKMKEKRDPCILLEILHSVKEIHETSVANDTSSLVPQRQKASDYDNFGLVPQLQNVSSSADAHVPLQQELYLLFGPLYDEFFTAGNSSVNKSYSLTNNSNQQDTQPTTNFQSTLEPSIPTYVHAEENNDNQAEEKYLLEDEFTNPFCTSVQEVDESSLHNIDLEMCMFALTVSTAEPKNIKEVMADFALIEAMQEELYQFDRLQIWELVDKPFGKSEAMADSAWIEVMQEELHQFDRLRVWELIDKTIGKMVIRLNWL